MKLHSVRDRITIVKEKLAMNMDFTSVARDLLMAGVLTGTQCWRMTKDAETNNYVLNRRLLDLVVTCSEETCERFLKALHNGSQRHVANFIRYNGGTIMFDLTFHCVTITSSNKNAGHIPT